MRRVGDKKWRRFASRKDASAAFPELSAADITHLINKTGNAKAKSETYEARDAVDEAEASDERGRFPCPAGCPRTFAHAPAAVQHGKSCAAAAAGGGAENAAQEPAAKKQKVEEGKEVTVHLKAKAGPRRSLKP